MGFSATATRDQGQIQVSGIAQCGSRVIVSLYQCTNNDCSTTIIKDQVVIDHDGPFGTHFDAGSGGTFVIGLACEGSADETLIPVDRAPGNGPPNPWGGWLIVGSVAVAAILGYAILSRKREPAQAFMWPF